MQIIAHSVAPPNPLPYLHVGYVSSSYNAHLVPMMTAGFCVLICVFFLQRMRWAPAKRLASIVTVAGIALLILAVVGPGPRRYHNPTLFTSSQASTLIRLIVQKQEGKEPIPPTLEEMRQAWGLEKKNTVDAWSRPLRIQTQKEGKHLSFYRG